MFLLFSAKPAECCSSWTAECYENRIADNLFKPCNWGEPNDNCTSDPTSDECRDFCRDQFVHPWFCYLIPGK